MPQDCKYILSGMFANMKWHLPGASKGIIRLIEILIQDLRAVAKVHRSHMIEILVHIS